MQKRIEGVCCVRVRGCSQFQHGRLQPEKGRTTANRKAEVEERDRETEEIKAEKKRKNIV